MDGEPNEEDIEAEAEVVEAELRGATTGIAGRIKHALGAVTGRDQLKRSGQAQEEQARAMLDFAEQPAAAHDDADAPRE